ncbi:MAG: tRNA (guanosine(46)-N7)-methyltransferase TrmB [Pirellulaceae bacterium]|nr:tRNA (guanosine(46)-N7)-methyltransferase TrmB [Planctomycetales bacterium]
MGRRSLPKLDPSLQLESHLLSFEALDSPWDPTRIYGRRAPLEIEVGSGKGLFLLTESQRVGAHNFLGIEIVRKYARYSAARLVKHQVANARMLQGDGQRFLVEFVPESSIRRVHVYFPDPWWKKRHRRRRVLNDMFLRHVERVLEPQGELHFWTDVEEYFQTTLETIATHTQLQGPLPVPERDAEHDMDYHTNFERRMRMHGLPVYRSFFIKRHEHVPIPAERLSQASDTEAEHADHDRP